MRLFRDLSPDIACPDHGPLRGQTKCRFCKYTVFSGYSSPGALPRATSDGGVGATFYPSAVQLDQDGSQSFTNVS